MMSFLCIAMIAVAQDIIVKKDGSVIKAKVTKVSSNEIEYKKFENMDGPTYAVNVSELLSITYQNGETERFSVAEQPQSLVINTDVYQGPQVSDAELLKMSKVKKYSYKKGKTLRTIGYITGGVLLAGGITFFVAYLENKDVQFDDPTMQYGVPSAICTGLAVFGGGTLILVGNNIMKKAKRVNTTALYEYNIPLGSNTMMTANVNLMKDNMTHQYAPGLGVNINF